MDLGKAIYDGNAKDALNYLKAIGISNPTDEQIRLEAYSRYRIGRPYHKPGGGKYEHEGVTDADKVNNIFNNKPWTNSENLGCRR